MVVGHLTLITRKLYEVPILEFKRASQDKKMFSNMIIECIPLPTYLLIYLGLQFHSDFLPIMQQKIWFHSNLKEQSKLGIPKIIRNFKLEH